MASAWGGAIAGGLMGAAWGAQNLLSTMREDEVTAKAAEAELLKEARIREATKQDDAYKREADYAFDNDPEKLAAAEKSRVARRAEGDAYSDSRLDENVKRERAIAQARHIAPPDHTDYAWRSARLEKVNLEISKLKNGGEVASSDELKQLTKQSEHFHKGIDEERYTGADLIKATKTVAEIDRRIDARMGMDVGTPSAGKEKADPLGIRIKEKVVTPEKVVTQVNKPVLTQAQIAALPEGFEREEAIRNAYNASNKEKGDKAYSDVKTAVANTREKIKGGIEAVRKQSNMNQQKTEMTETQAKWFRGLLPADQTRILRMNKDDQQMEFSKH